MFNVFKCNTNQRRYPHVQRDVYHRRKINLMLASPTCPTTFHPMAMKCSTMIVHRAESSGSTSTLPSMSSFGAHVVSSHAVASDTIEDIDGLIVGYNASISSGVIALSSLSCASCRCKAYQSAALNR